MSCNLTLFSKKEWTLCLLIACSKFGCPGLEGVEGRVDLLGRRLHATTARTTVVVIPPQPKSNNPVSPTVTRDTCGRHGSPPAQSLTMSRTPGSGDATRRGQHHQEHARPQRSHNAAIAAQKRAAPSEVPPSGSRSTRPATSAAAGRAVDARLSYFCASSVTASDCK